VRVEPPVPAQTLSAIRAALTAAGATPVDAPILQPLGLLIDLAGEAMRARLFVVQAEGGAEACLRPDFTVAVARQHIE
jgi:ATP phosphoribosyltransferase regulatory subunit